MQLIHIIAIVWLGLSLGRISIYIWSRQQPEFWEHTKPGDLDWFKETMPLWDTLTILWLIPSGAIYGAIDLYRFVYRNL